ncbi:MAG: capsular biosynthesis protein [Brumimicrobium sp.]|nr:capsular biosynthesis protein [Brumimicrobium sp.]MCO5269145.1 histidinol phosphatase [Brumimicrobium sp.]
MFSLFRKHIDSFNLASVAVDMHSHLIPGIDDGAKDMDNTMELLRKFSELGYQKVITTPHIYWDYYKNTSEIILEGLQKVRERVEQEQLPIQVEAAAEYFFDAHFLDLIDNDEILTFGDKYVLFELPFLVEPYNVDQLIFLLLGKGYKPIMAHFERYLYYHSKTLAMAEDFRRRGVAIQLNLLSLTGHYGESVRHQAELMIEKNLVDFVGTDCHRIEHLEIIKRNLKKKNFSKLSELNLKNNQLL